MAEIYKHIADVIRKHRSKMIDPRTEKPMSQEALASAIGVAANTVSRWETGTYKPTADDLDKLARFFKVSILVFFPDLRHDDVRTAALTSAIGGLTEKDFKEVLNYAEFRKARQALESIKRTRSKG
jgi:transcriptional regulator with XRE-family HTH domain